MVDKLLLIAYSLNMNYILTVSIIVPTVDGGFKRWDREVSLECFRYSRVPFCDVDEELKRISDDAVNLKVLEDHPDSSVPIHIMVKLDQLRYEFQYDMVYGGGDKNFINNYGEPPDFYRYLKTRLMITAGIGHTGVIKRYEWGRCIDKDCVNYKDDLRKLYRELYDCYVSNRFVRVI